MKHEDVFERHGFNKRLDQRCQLHRKNNFDSCGDVWWYGKVK